MNSTLTADKPRTPSRRLPVVAGARLTVAESEQLRVTAAQRGLSVSTFLRGLVLDAIRPEQVVQPSR